jgi:hypothetical protein
MHSRSISAGCLHSLVPVFVTVCLYGQQDTLNSQAKRDGPDNSTAGSALAPGARPLLNSVRATYRGAVVAPVITAAGPSAGRLMPAACAFHFHLERGQRVMEVRYLSQPRFRPDGACEAELEVGVPTVPRRPASGPGATMLQVNGRPASRADATSGRPEAARLSELVTGRADVIELLPQPDNFLQPAIAGLDPRGVRASNTPRPEAANPPWRPGLAYAYEEIDDPVNVAVNYVETYLNYYFTYGDYPGCMPDVSATGGYWWLSYTGWSLLSYDTEDGVRCSSNTPCVPAANYGFAQSYGAFGNLAFCIVLSPPGVNPGYTLVQYWPLEVDGRWDGTADAFAALYIGGSWCASLLGPTAITFTNGPND